MPFYWHIFLDCFSMFYMLLLISTELKERINNSINNSILLVLLKREKVHKYFVVSDCLKIYFLFFISLKIHVNPKTDQKFFRKICY